MLEIEKNGIERRVFFVGEQNELFFFNKES
jgi:hypothetical protein